MSLLRNMITELYAADSKAAVRFVNKTNRLVRIGKHWWRGYAKIKDEVEVKVAGRTVSKESTTGTQYKCLPDRVREEFTAFERAIDKFIRDRCGSGRLPPPPKPGTDPDEADDRPKPLVFGNGVFGIDAAAWPQAEKVLTAIQAEWGEAADRLCTEDGYAALHTDLKAQLGEQDYELRKHAIPARDALRTKFWLEVTPMAFRLAEEVDTALEDKTRLDMVVESIETVVRGPREEAAATWEALAGQLASYEGGELVAQHPVTVDKKTGEVRPTKRRIHRDTVINAREATEGLSRAARSMDDDLRMHAGRLIAEFPSNGVEELASYVIKINADDTEAVRVAKMLLAAASAARDEANMCAGLRRAMES